MREKIDGMSTTGPPKLKRRQVVLDLNTKVEIYTKLQKGASQAALSQEYSCRYYTLQYTYYTLQYTYIYTCVQY